MLVYVSMAMVVMIRQFRKWSISRCYYLLFRIYLGMLRGYDQVSFLSKLNISFSLLSTLEEDNQRMLVVNSQGDTEVDSVRSVLFLITFNSDQPRWVPTTSTIIYYTLGSYTK